MKKCITEIMKNIRALESDKARVEMNIRRKSTVTYTEDEIIKQPDFNLNEELEKYNEINEKILKLKSLVQVSNCKTVVYEGHTMQECLVLVAQLSSLRLTLTALTNQQELIRRNVQGVIEYTKTQYDIEQVKNEYDRLGEKLTALQMAMDLSNLTTMVEI